MADKQSPSAAEAKSATPSHERGAAAAQENPREFFLAELAPVKAIRLNVQREALFALTDNPQVRYSHTILALNRVTPVAVFGQKGDKTKGLADAPRKEDMSTENLSILWRGLKMGQVFDATDNPMTIPEPDYRPLLQAARVPGNKDPLLAAGISDEMEVALREMLRGPKLGESADPSGEVIKTITELHGGNYPILVALAHIEMTDKRRSRILSALEDLIVKAEPTPKPGKE